MVTEYAKLCTGERYGAHTVEVVETATGKRGVANTMPLSEGIYPEMGVAVFYGNDDGSDDAIIKADAFSARFKVTNIIF